MFNIVNQRYNSTTRSSAFQSNFILMVLFILLWLFELVHNSPQVSNIHHFEFINDRGYIRWFNLCPPSQIAILEMIIVHYNISTGISLKNIEYSPNDFYLRYSIYQQLYSFRGASELYFYPILSDNFDLYGNFEGNINVKFEVGGNLVEKKIKFGFSKYSCKSRDVVFISDPKITLYNERNCLLENTLSPNQEKIYVSLSVSTDEGYSDINPTNFSVEYYDVVRENTFQKYLVENVDYFLLNTTKNFSKKNTSDNLTKNFLIINNKWKNVYFSRIRIIIDYDAVTERDSVANFRISKLVFKSEVISGWAMMLIMLCINAVMFCWFSGLALLIFFVIFVIIRRPRFLFGG